MLCCRDVLWVTLLFIFKCHFRCNVTSECPGGEDELNCKKCQPAEFECKNKKCISDKWVCDKHDDCGDASDEEGELCGQTPQNRTKIIFERLHQQIRVPCEDGFRCKTGHCIELAMVCNGVENCYDGSDEYGSCGEFSYYRLHK